MRTSLLGRAGFLDSRQGLWRPTPARPCAPREEHADSEQHPPGTPWLRPVVAACWTGGEEPGCCAAPGACRGQGGKPRGAGMVFKCSRSFLRI